MPTPEIDDDARYYVVYRAQDNTAPYGTVVYKDHISRPFATLRDAKHYLKAIATSRRPRVLVEVVS